LLAESYGLDASNAANADHGNVITASGATSYGIYATGASSDREQRRRRRLSRAFRRFANTVIGNRLGGVTDSSTSVAGRQAPAASLGTRRLHLRERCRAWQW
jgi:hypothetical protein